ncbi:MAG TPA: 1-(5-phosphoribosyl)-5-[(5-phosphoribosylamino)methylideneamino]imidazole-4-carboxamide isomerase [Deltaproteobacteria bacterium]|jgi:phosphoribosylformimino-5-aminoimidazole carboxamide ribotide isomerase|nr:1-(5-phosphoribosyl)-5-[(5-phosphoribosylamino)methylideneamino]imidazole-4-carboxamide isomerase [Deltaproteobacteria bacterium]
MIVIPAIDLHEGSVVRLRKGVFEDVTYYSSVPADVAKAFRDAGARRIHVVDLDGSVKGQGVNTKAIESICRASGVEVELGGGIRSEEDADRAFGLGVTYVILGTIIATQPEKAREIIQAYPGKVGIGIDALKGCVAVRGWKEITRQKAVSLAREFEAACPAFVVYTDIDRDGMLTGPNIEATAEMARSISIPVVASGGVSSMDDIRALKGIPGLMGVITGKAVYEGLLDVEAAIRECQP